MKPEAQRIAIAEAYGWRWERMPNFDAFYSADGHYRGGATHDLTRALNNAGVPDYPYNLNAIAPAVGAWVAKHGYMLEIHLGSRGTWTVEITKAMPMHRRVETLGLAVNESLSDAFCEAFLKALNLWTE